MAPAKRLRQKSPVVTVSADMLLEIVARSDHTTLVRCAAACKSLRRRILDSSFLRRVCTNEDGPAIIPPHVLAYLHNRKKEPMVSLVHPTTRLAASFTNGSLAPYVQRCVSCIHRTFEPLMSRGGLIVLHRRYSIDISNNIRRMYEDCYELCVFDPITGARTYISCRPGLHQNQFFLLTATDGIGYSFLLLVTKVDRCDESGGFRIMVQATKPGDTCWGSVTHDVHCLFPFMPLQQQREPVVLQGGIIHWLLWEGDQVLTYDICTQSLGTLKLPLQPTSYAGSQRLILGTSPDGRRLRLLYAERFMVAVWVQLSDGWTKEAVIDVEHKLGSLHPKVSLSHMSIQFKRWGERSGTVLLAAYHNNRVVHRDTLIVLDLNTKKMRRINLSNTSLLFEVDLSMRLQSHENILIPRTNIDYDREMWSPAYGVIRVHVYPIFE